MVNGGVNILEMDQMIVYLQQIVTVVVFEEFSKYNKIFYYYIFVVYKCVFYLLCNFFIYLVLT